MKFKAKPKFVDRISSEEGILLDVNNYIHGWYVDGFIVGRVNDVDEEYISLDYWCRVDKSTLKRMDDDSSEQLNLELLINQFKDEAEQANIKLSHKQERNVILNRASELPDGIKKEIIAELLKGLRTD